MPKISALPSDTSPTTDDVVPTLDSGTSTLKKSTWANIINMIFGNAPTASLARQAVDWSSFSNNIKSATTTTLNTPTNGSNNDLSGNGAVISFTVAASCVAFVTVNVAPTSTSDFENRPQIWLDGSLYYAPGYSAAAGSSGNRGVSRSISSTVPLTTGAHTISAGLFISSASSCTVPSGAANITAIVLGNVTA